MSGATGIQVEHMTKSFGATRALDGLDLVVAAGSVVAVLGPNGAGKSTLTRILATLALADGGKASVAGFDVATQPGEVRSRIGVTGQSTSLDEYLTGRQNLVMVGRLSRLAKRSAQARAAELLDQFQLVDAADRPTKTYSGGMLRKLDLAASLVTRPEVLFLDEPTTGLDPRARLGMWDVIRDLGAEGTTILLTTQYLDEADQLAQQIAVVDHGLVIARGTSDELKARVGGEVLEVTLGDGSDARVASELLSQLAGGLAVVDPSLHRVSVPIGQSHGSITEVVRTLDRAGLVVDDIAIRRPGLDDVFMKLTGHAADAMGGTA